MFASDKDDEEDNDEKSAFGKIFTSHSPLVAAVPQIFIFYLHFNSLI